MAALGAAAGLGGSEADSVGGALVDTAAGGVLGGALGAAGKGIGKGLDALGGKVSGALGAARDKATAKVSSELAEQGQSIAGKVGGETQKGSRLVENLKRLRDMVDPTQQQAIDSFLGTPEARELASSVAESSLRSAPETVGKIGAAKAAQEAFQAQAPELLESGVESALSGSEAKRQLMDRAKRYAIPAAAGWLTDKALGGGDDSSLVKWGIGMAAGRGVSPMVQALTRMSRNPAVQTQALKGVQKLLGAAPTGGRVLARGAGQEAAEQTGAAASNFARSFPDLSRSLGLSEDDQDPLALGGR
jgi:hypothetical protein